MWALGFANTNKSKYTILTTVFKHLSDFSLDI